MTTLVRRRIRSLTVVPVVALSCGLLVLAGCSSDTSSATPAGQPSASGQNGGQAGGTSGGTGGNDPGRVSGEIAAVDGKTLQVQDGESQTAVTYTSKTTFTAQVAGTVSDISTGDCVMVFSSSTGENATELTATTVTASTATDGTCAAGFGGGTRPSGAPSGQPSAGGQAPDGQAPSGGPSGAAPSGAPSGAAPSGAPSGMRNGGGRPQTGKVTAVDGDTLIVEVTQRDSDTKTKVTVKTTSDTKIAVTEKSRASAAKVGVCATVNGKADDTGAVAAKTITLRAAGDDGCSMRRANR